MGLYFSPFWEEDESFFICIKDSHVCIDRSINLLSYRNLKMGRRLCVDAQQLKGEVVLVPYNWHSAPSPRTSHGTPTPLGLGHANYISQPSWPRILLLGLARWGCCWEGRVPAPWRLLAAAAVAQRGWSDSDSQLPATAAPFEAAPFQ